MKRVAHDQWVEMIWNHILNYYNKPMTDKFSWRKLSNANNKGKKIVLKRTVQFINHLRNKVVDIMKQIPVQMKKKLTQLQASEKCNQISNMK